MTLNWWRLCLVPEIAGTCFILWFFKGYSTSRVIFKFFFNEHKIKWQWCEATRTGDAEAMTGTLSSLISWRKKRRQLSYFY